MKGLKRYEMVVDIYSCQIDWYKVIKFFWEIFLTGFGVYSDVNLGIKHQKEKNVTRTFLASTLLCYISLFSGC